MRTIDINSDLGESFGNWKLGDDEAVIPVITSANVACGFHASDPMTMLRTVRSGPSAESSASASLGPKPLAVSS